MSLLILLIQFKCPEVFIPLCNAIDAVQRTRRKAAICTGKYFSGSMKGSLELGDRKNSLPWKIERTRLALMAGMPTLLDSPVLLFTVGQDHPTSTIRLTVIIYNVCIAKTAKDFSHGLGNASSLYWHYPVPTPWSLPEVPMQCHSHLLTFFHQSSTFKDKYLFSSLALFSR